MNSIHTTGGVFTEEMRQIVLNNIINVFSCAVEDSEELMLLSYKCSANFIIEIIPFVYS